MLWLGIYIAVISFLGFVLVVYDKAAALAERRRIAEWLLFFVAMLGGAAVMFITMQLIRHKTRRAAFMAGLPIIFVLQLTAAYLLVKMLLS